MAGQLTIDTLKASSGVLSVANGMTGIAKAWVNFNGSGVINASFNVGSVTVLSSGNYQINFTTAMPSANYVVACTTQTDSASLGTGPWFVGLAATSGVPATKTTTAVRIETKAQNGSNYSASDNSLAVFGA